MERPALREIPDITRSLADRSARVLSRGRSRLVQNPKRLLMVYTGAETKWIRQVWIGRQHPKDLTDYEPVWMGHSVGRWEGDTLVVDTVRIKTHQER